MVLIYIYIENEHKLNAYSYIYRCFIRKRENGTRKFVLALLGISVFKSMTRGSHNGLLFTERMFRWDVIKYTNYQAFEMSIAAIR